MRDDGFAEAPGPVDVLIEVFEYFWVIEQCNDRIVPLRIGFQRRVFLEFLEEARSVDELEYVLQRLL